jgi:hypothetical protein
MRKRFIRRQHLVLIGGILCVFALVAASGARGDARVTATVGTAHSEGQALEQRAALDDVADLETGDDGKCSVLVDQDALMELCAGTRLKLARKEGQPDGPRIVQLDRGEIRVVAEPRLGEERIEIHTPAAIATLLGSAVHVSVDALGVTTITWIASEGLVTSNESSIPGSTRMGPGEQLVIAPGKPPPPQAEKLSQRELEGRGRGGCLVDFHDLALGLDRDAHEKRMIREMSNADIPDGDLPGVGAGGEGPGEGFEPPNDPDPEPPFEPTQLLDIRPQEYDWPELPGWSEREWGEY